MNEIILKNFFKKISNDQPIQYSPNIKVNLIQVAMDEFKNLAIPYKKDSKSENVLHLYSDSDSPLRYVKGFYPNNTRLGKSICADKFLTQRFLDNACVKTPVGKLFKPDELVEAKSFISNNSSTKYVLKPVSMSMSLGTFLNVDESNLESSWERSFNVQKKYKVENPRILIQEQIQGLELRVLVVEGKVDSAVFRGPGNVKGDGQHTIQELIEIKNVERSQHNYLNRNPLKINDNLLENLKNKNLTLETVLADGEYCILYSQSDIATGREVFEVSKYLDTNIFNQALDAVTAIPGAHTAGVDIFVEDLDATEGTVIEVNLNPALQLHYYPMTGEKTMPLYDIFKNCQIDRKILNDEINVNNITEDELKTILDRYKYLFNKQKSLSNSFNMFLNL
ncbi:hypothetical protein [Jeotgalicoccus sp. ATCC 8456]|uniref:hypothetical protein n=1 Tax=Jeotgalicoccus sp. ATCC 8456 TaxID=946435 RepID=UPI0018E63CFB|nr:hypothetical protein [Jeotgalicoccus sp. ATCC 8456]QQD85652.1 hypothetical protein JEM45_03240 [Jeotgalicoccus sp. ATCC 8456]